MISIGDVTGHGLQASIIMAKIRHSLNAVAMYENDLSRMLDVAEAITLRRFPLAIATAFVAFVDTNAGTITDANAGHPRPLLRARDGSIKELSAYGLPIGVRHLGTKSPEHTTMLNGVEMAVLFTDGLTEATRDLIAGEQRLHNAISPSRRSFGERSGGFPGSNVYDGASLDDVALMS